MIDEHEVALGLARHRLFSFVHLAFGRLYPAEDLSDAPYLEAFCFQLQECAERRQQRLIACMPPRHLKSFTLVCLQAWLLGHDPTAEIIFVTYGDELSRTLTEIFRDIVRSDWYQDIFPDMRIDPASDRQEVMRTTAGGGRRPVSTGSALTGFGGNVIITDDLAKAQDTNYQALRDRIRRFLDEVLFSRQNNPDKDIFIAAQQRLHVDDAIARLLELPNFKRLILPSIAVSDEAFELYGGRVWKRRAGDLLEPTRFSRKTLEEIRLRNPSVYEAQYQQAPHLVVSALVDVNKITFVPAPPPPERVICTLQFWDTSFGVSEDGDFSVGLCFAFANRCWHLVDMVRGRFTYPVLRQIACEFADRWKAWDIIVEAQGCGASLVQDLRANGRKNFFKRTVSEAKEVRLFAQSGFLQSNRFAVVETPRWTPDFRREVACFPNDKHNDIVDALTLGVDHIQREGPATVRKVLNGGVPPRRLGRGRPFPSIYGDEAEDEAA
ncbi:MAG: hypothetical protein Q8R02_24035 [Hyphomonadaceae bacterium]|nr:hypothetical protein [Hyphomonadaceae bacterium]